MKTISELQQEIRSMQMELQEINNRLSNINDALLNYKDSGLTIPNIREYVKSRKPCLLSSIRLFIMDIQ